MPLVREISIENYKSIRKLTMELGRVNVLIGANGSGKSNLLEAIAVGSAGARQKLDNEYLVPRGVRVVEPRFMRSAFAGDEARDKVVVSFRRDGADPLKIHVDPHRRAVVFNWPLGSATSVLLDRLATEPPGATNRELMESLFEQQEKQLPPDFLIYAPESSSLRVFQSESQILPLSVKGEGLFAHLKALSARDGAERLARISDELALLDWFERLEIPRDLAAGERSVLIRDRFLAEGALFDQRSANEGFLFLLFYFTLFISDGTPSFFAIDNVDASLNPKVITALMRRLIPLATAHDKQVIFTTHNPAVLDGLDLTDDEQRLFVTERAKDGPTRVRRVRAPTPVEGDAPVPLSEAFVRGYLGGLPKNF